MEKLISVVIPTHCRSTFLCRSVKSVLEQTYKNIELIIVNDNYENDEYTKDVYSLCDSIGDNRIRIVQPKEHKNAATARNNGLKECNGDFVAFLDDDDYWEKVFLETLFKAFLAVDNQTGAVSCLTKRFKGDKIWYVSSPYPDGYIAKEVYARCIDLPTGSILFKKDCLDQIGFFEPDLIRLEEVKFFGQFCQKFKIKLVNKYLYNVDVSDGQNRKPVFENYKYRQVYLQSIDKDIKEWTKRDKRHIVIMHNFELSKGYFKHKQFLKGIKLLFPVILHIYTFKWALRKVYERIKGMKQTKRMLRKYDVRK